MEKYSLSEERLELKFIKQLEKLGYKYVKIENEEDLVDNLKNQLEIFNQKELNNKKLSKSEFDKILNHLEKGSIQDKSIKLRDRFELVLDNGDLIYIRFFNSEKWCQNLYQVTHQITIEGKYENRYDVTILINGLPLTQIELKKNGLSLKEAFNQTIRYQKHSFGYNFQLFQYIQVFVISNETNTKYYANNKFLKFENTFYWANRENQNITNIEDFTECFLEHCQLSKMISQYIVISEIQETNFILKPYQCIAVESIIDRIDNTNLNGYIWHTTGSGKTLTSFKTAQILKSKDKLKKILFVVDRKDLDYQTTMEFNNFSKGCVDGTENTTSLYKQLLDKNIKLIVTTIQKLNIIVKKLKNISKPNNKIEKEELLKKLKINELEFEELLELATSKNVFIFDECHRSQFGESHKNISEYFKKSQLIGFTGTPIFSENANGKQTTKDLFTKQLHNYTIVDAIADENVLGFNIKYVNTFKKDKDKIDSNTDKAHKINTSEIYDSKDRMKVVVNDIISRHNVETNNKKYNGIFAVSNIEHNIQFYKMFKEKKHNLKIASIFSFTANEEDRDDGNLEESDKMENGLAKHSRDELDIIMQDYNKVHGTKYNTNNFDGYYKDISRRFKNGEIDILIVVNMFLTGFDSKRISVLYCDKNFKYHGLLQGFSRTNRIDTVDKPFGNIVSYRNIKEDVDKTIELFANKEAKEIVFQPSFKELLKDFNQNIKNLKKVSKTPSEVDKLKSEKEQTKFVLIFRTLIRLNKKLDYFPEYKLSEKENGINSYDFDSFKSKYLDLYEKTHKDNTITKTSILNEINFETELLTSDKINVDYILELLKNIISENDKDKKDKKRKDIFELIDREPKLRYKRELIEDFFEMQEKNKTNQTFNEFKKDKRKVEVELFCKNNNIDLETFDGLLSSYCYNPSENYFIGDNTIDPNKISLNKVGIMQRKSIIQKVISKITIFQKKYC